MLPNKTINAIEILATAEESVRLAILDSYDVLDTLPEKELDALTQLAAHICNKPIALITLIDKNRQWYKSAFGMATGQTARELSFASIP
jgi:hypothetical protein